MMKNSVRLKVMDSMTRVDNVPTRDAQNRDMLLTAGKILHAEETPQTANLGRTWTGEGQSTVSQVNGLLRAIGGGAIDNTITDAEKAELARILLKYSSGGSSASVNSAGIAQVGGAVQDSLRNVRDGINQIKSINAAAKTYWDDKQAQQERARR